MCFPPPRLTTAALFLFLALAGDRSCLGQDLINNGGFENGTTGWGIFVPDESAGKNCRFDVVDTSPHSGKSCAKLQSDDFARFALGNSASIPVQAGEHYRVTAWVKADPSAQVRPETHGLPSAGGFVIRLLLHQGTADVPGGHIFIGQGGAVTRDNPAVATSLPKDWTKVEAVVEIPPGTDTVLPSLFSWWVNGTFFVDDFSIVKVDAASGSSPAPKP